MIRKGENKENGANNTMHKKKGTGFQKHSGIRSKFFLTIKTKQIASFTLFLVIILILGLLSIWSLKIINQHSSDISNKLVPELNLANSMEEEIANFRAAGYQYISASSATEKKSIEKDMNSRITSLNGEIQTYESMSGEDMSVLKQRWERYQKINAEILKYGSAGDAEQAMQLMNIEGKIVYNIMQQKLDTVIADKAKQISDESREGNQLYSMIFSVITKTVAVCMLIGLMLQFWNIRGVTIPLKKLRNKLKELVENGGDLTQRIEVRRRDEIGELAEVINLFIANIGSIIAEVNQSAERVALSAENVEQKLYRLNANMEESSSTVEELSAGMQETAASAEEINATSDEIQQAVSVIALRAREGAGAVDEISQRANQLQTSAEHSSQASISIFSTSRDRLTQALEKSREIEQVRDFTEAILEISDQTNLLALNAAIEAARAGEAGRGFSVVADEIGRLAVNSKDTVEKIQKVTEHVVASVQDLAENTRVFLDYFSSTVVSDYEGMVATGNQYLKDAGFTDGLVRDFSSNSDKLTASVDEIIRSISEVSQTITASAGETQSIADKIAGIAALTDEIRQEMQISTENAVHLKAAVEKFRV